MEFTLTKEDILKEVSEIDIFNYYLKEYYISVDFDKRYVSPFRNDKKPDCSFGYSKKGTLVFNDWAYNMYNCFDIVMKKYNINFGKAIRKIEADIPHIKRKDFDVSGIKINVTNKPSKINEENPIRIKRKLFSKNDLKFWNIEGLNITPNLLQKNKIYSIECYWVNNVHFRVNNIGFAYHWEDFNYEIYLPYNDGILKPRFLISPKLIIGDEEFLPETGNHLVITKSKKDAFYLRLLGVNAIFIVREKMIIDEFTMTLFQVRFKNVFTLFDNDLTGITLTNKYYKKYNTIPLYFSRLEYKKDFTDNLKFFGVQCMLELIEEIKEQYEI